MVTLHHFLIRLLASNNLLYRMVTLHHFLIRLLAKKEMMISLFISTIFR